MNRSDNNLKVQCLAKLESSRVSFQERCERWKASWDEVMATRPDLPFSDYDGQKMKKFLETISKKLAHTVTKLSISCKPPGSFRDAIKLLDELEAISEMLELECLQIPKSRGKYMLRDMLWCLRNLFGECLSLCNSLATLIRNDEGAQSVLYLISTGMLWDFCEALTTISTNEKSVILEDLYEHDEILSDVILEMKSLLEETENQEAEGSSIDETEPSTISDADVQMQKTSGEISQDDMNLSNGESGTQQLEKLFEKTMSLSGKASYVINTVLSLMKTTKLLLKKIEKRCIEDACDSTKIEDVVFMDTVTDWSNELLELADEIGSGCHPEQDLYNLTFFTRKFVCIATDLCKLSAGKTNDKHVQWFELCERRLLSIQEQLTDLAPIR